MGLRLFGRSFSSHDTTAKKFPLPADSNPDPTNFRITSLETFKGVTVLEVTYPDAMNFEGKKILVFKDVPIQELLNAKVLDPHFHDDSLTAVKSPIARFKPTPEGLEMARVFAKTLVKGDTT